MFRNISIACLDHASICKTSNVQIFKNLFGNIETYAKLQAVLICLKRSDSFKHVVCFHIV